jgi:hypothetical protein
MEIADGISNGGNGEAVEHRWLEISDSHGRFSLPVQAKGQKTTLESIALNAGTERQTGNGCQSKSKPRRRCRNVELPPENRV